jgi:hypothetical protein
VTEIDRTQVLQDLLMLRTPVPEAAQRLKEIPWDSDVGLVTLTRTDGRRLLDAYLDGSLGDEAVEQWANAIEGRDDIEMEEGYEALLKDFVFELATPEITRRITRSTATEWRRRLD